MSRVAEQMSLKSFAESQSRTKVPDVEKNLVPNICTADGEGALSELCPCPHDNSCVGCGGTELAAPVFRDVEFHDFAEIMGGP